MNRVELVFAIDTKFAQHCGVTLVSAFENNPDLSFRVHIFFGEKKPEKLRILTNLIREYGHEVKVHYFDPAMTAGFSVFGHVSSATYYRIFIPELIDPEIKKFIYLDADVLILGSVTELWNMPIQEYTLAAVLENDQVTFNAGVLLVNTDRWRERRITALSAAWLTENRNNIVYWDQDALNAVLDGEVLRVGAKWNWTDCTAGENKIVSEDVRILHFVGAHKPWNYYCTHPLREMYFSYLKKTPWRGFKFEEKTFRYKLRTKWNRILKLVGIQKS